MLFWGKRLTNYTIDDGLFLLKRPVVPDGGAWFCLRTQFQRKHIAAGYTGRGFEPGQEVEITRGPFRGLKALVTRLITARERVDLLIEWMGRTLRAEAGVTDLEPSGRGAGCCQKI